MSKTIADNFFSDPRVLKAKKLLLDTLAEHQRGLQGIRPSAPELKTHYEELLKEFGRLRGGSLFFPYLGSGIGKGCLVELADGSVKYDFISGIGVHHWGHSHPALIEAAIDAALRDTIMQGNLQQIAESVEVTRDLLSAANRTGARLEHCFLSTSGAMANENALKIIFQKKHPANRLLAFEGCFMGRTLALSQVTDKPDYRAGLPPTLSVDYVPYFDAAQPEESIRAAVDSVKRHMRRHPGKHAAMCFELALGEGGFYPGSRDFFLALMELAKQNQLAVMLDEIQTFGRTEQLFAFQYFGLDESIDVLTLGKLSQLCATLFTEEYNPRPGLLSQTFTSSTSALFAARTMLHGLLEGGYFGPDGKIARLHNHFVKRLKEIREQRPDLIAGPFGLGAMIAFTPLGGEPARVKEFVHALFEAGVISFYAGSELSRVRFLVPVGAVSFQDIDSVSTIIEDTLVRMA